MRRSHPGEQHDRGHSIQSVGSSAKLVGLPAGLETLVADQVSHGLLDLAASLPNRPLGLSLRLRRIGLGITLGFEALVPGQLADAFLDFPLQLIQSITDRFAPL